MAFVSLRLEKELMNRIENCMKQNNYSTKTEFIRDSLRDKINVLETEKRKNEQWDKLLAMRGTLKGKGIAKTDEEFRKIRERIGDKILADYEKKLKEEEISQKEPLQASAQQ